MKKSIISLIMVMTIITVLPVSAQVKLGIKEDMNLSQMSLDKDVFNISNCTGFFIDSILKTGLPTPGLGLDLSTLYSRQEVKVEDVNNKFNTVLKQQQLIVPVNVKYSTGMGSTANIFVFIGPQIAFSIGDGMKKLSDFEDQAAEWTLKSSNFSVNAGLGLTVVTRFQATANYSVGVGKTGDITWGGVKESMENRKAQANSWRVGVIYFF